MKYFFVSLFFLPIAQVVLIVTSVSGCHFPAKEPITVAFYNLENLFDTINDLTKLDDDFTPYGKQGWTADRYQTKVEHLSRVVHALGSPALLGLAEVENLRVLEDLQDKISTPLLNYEIAHIDSPDPRGIDVALLFHKELFHLLSLKAIRVSGEFDGITLHTRDILYVRLRPNTGDDIHLFVNHWPSRSGGVEKSAPKRLAAAKTLAGLVAELGRTEKNPTIILMGDFNDTPQDPSLHDIVLSIPNQSGDLLLANPFIDFMLEQKGSYNFRGSWDMIDQIIISRNMLRSRHKPRFQRAGIFQQEWMMHVDNRYGLSPFRTYGGPKYYGGYSDHLPVFVKLN